MARATLRKNLISCACGPPSLARSIATNTTIVLNVRDINEPPTLVAPANQSFWMYDNNYEGDVFYQFVSVDDDFVETRTWRLLGGVIVMA